MSRATGEVAARLTGVGHNWHGEEQMPANGRSPGSSHLRIDRRRRQQGKHCRVADDYYPAEDSAASCGA